jgi:hypothetical protein
MDWVLPTDEIIAKVEMLAAEERKAAVPSPMNHNNGELERPKRGRNDIASGWRKFAFPFQAQCLKVVFSTFCGSEPWAGPADCTAHYASSLTSLANRGATLCVKRFGYNLIRRLLGFYPITQSSTAPIV